MALTPTPTPTEMAYLTGRRSPWALTQVAPTQMKMGCQMAMRSQQVLTAYNEEEHFNSNFLMILIEAAKRANSE